MYSKLGSIELRCLSNVAFGIHTDTTSFTVLKSRPVWTNQFIVLNRYNVIRYFTVKSRLCCNSNMNMTWCLLSEQPTSGLLYCVGASQPVRLLLLTWRWTMCFTAGSRPRLEIPAVAHGSWTMIDDRHLHAFRSVYSWPIPNRLCRGWYLQWGNPKRAGLQLLPMIEWSLQHEVWSIIWRTAEQCLIIKLGKTWHCCNEQIAPH